MRLLIACSLLSIGCSGYISCGPGAGPEAVRADPRAQPQPATATPATNESPTHATSTGSAALQPAAPPTHASKHRRQLKLLDGEVPALTGHVTDKATLLDAADHKVLEHILALYERRTGHQFAILTVPNLRGASVADLGFTVASRTGLGRRDKDDGLLITVAREERTVDIQVGHGMEQAIPDEFAARVIREKMAPAFRTNDYATGMHEGLKELMLAGETVK